MTKQKTTKKTLLTSVLSLVLCVAMLIGTTFAWFTDSVASNGNIIKSGNLQVGMYWGEAKLDPDTMTEWNDASKGAIFNNNLWEPGYIEAKHIKIVNEGNLALKYQMRIIANGIVSELADVIDVYYFDTAVQLSRASLTAANKLGTLAEVLNYGEANTKSLTQSVVGELKKGESNTITLALKMQESAGNEYQNLSIGTDFSVQILATQLASEEDSFGSDYDKNSKYPAQDMPSAQVFKLTGKELEITDVVSGKALTLDAGYQFLPTESGEVVDSESIYKNWHADFVVSADNDVAANSLMLAGYYKLFDDVMQLNGGWIGLTSPNTVKAGEELRLVQQLATINYSMVCNYGNDGIGFLCGVKDLDGSNKGTTITVRLRLFEVEEGSDVETGNYTDVGIFEYTFGGDYVTAENGAIYFEGNDGDVSLYSAKDVKDVTFEIPEGVTAIDTVAFGGNTTTKNVVFPETVTSIGYNAFKDSAVESVSLNEGLTEIAGFAFNGAKSLAQFNIPSTVKSIGQHAFRQVALNELVIPATVEKVDSSFRDMPNLTTVTFEGNTEIAPYAFRGCANLTDVHLKGNDVTFAATDAAGNKGMVFTNLTSGDANKITIHVENSTVAARVITAQTSSYGYKVTIAGEQYVAKSANTSAQLATVIKETAADSKTFVVLNEGTYADDINLTIAAQGGQKGDLYIKAADGKNVILSGKTTLGLYERGTTNVAAWNAKVIFEGIIFEQTTASTHSIEVQNIEKFILRNCTIIGEGEYGIGSVSGNIAFNSEITGCSLKNGAMQVTGNFGTGLVIDDCTFNDFRVNVQGGNGVTIKNSKFNATVTEAYLTDNFYVVRSNDTPINIEGCTFNVDSEVSGLADASKYWTVFCPRKTGNTKWIVNNIKVNFTDAAMNSALTLVNNLTTTEANKSTRITITGLTSDSNDVAQLITKSAGYMIVDGNTYLDGVKQ